MLLCFALFNFHQKESYQIDTFLNKFIVKLNHVNFAYSNYITKLNETLVEQKNIHSNVYVRILIGSR